MNRFTLSLLLAGGLCFPSLLTAANDWVVYEPSPGPGMGKHLVFLSGDEEYRSEEGLPMLAKILSQRHGFKCTVLFSVNDQGEIDPNRSRSLTHPEALDSADAIVMLLRFRDYPDAVMKHFVDAFQRGVPIIALRTSTHAFQFKGDSSYKAYNDFGKEVLGERWVTHWGRHKREATLGVLEPSALTDPILHGVQHIFGDTDVYEAHPPADARILVRGRVLEGMDPSDPPASYAKVRATDGATQDINDPMMPVAWTRLHKHESGVTNKIFCTTMGSATDLQSEGLRRLVVNAVYWGLGMEIPAKANVEYVGEFHPTSYGFDGAKKGVKPSDHELKSSSANGDGAALPLRLERGDHVALIGNALADRMQHDGWFETLVTAAFPEHDLVFRNLAVAGDELATRHRSANFGSPHEWLERVEADVVLAFFGFNESFDGPDGLDRFARDLDNFIKETTRMNYSGDGAPRLVLISPIATERHQDRNFPFYPENNENLERYTETMARVAAENGVGFVDLFRPSQELFVQAAAKKESLTINGYHLSPEGNRPLAPVLFEGLFGAEPPSGDLTKLREAINDKNAAWHARYRTIDGYNVYGGRSQLSFESGPGGPKITNFEVMQEEMAQRDVMTANRDKRVWAVAKGGDLIVNDSNVPPVTPVRSNKPGPKPDESHVFLGGEEAIARMKVHAGMKVNLFASEEDFPELVNPVQMAWDTRGRLWVVAWLNYPERKPLSETGDSLLVFEDTDRDGRADTCTHFLDDLNAPTGFQFYKDGVLVMQAPDFWFVRDMDGDGRGDWKQRMLMGMDSADSHHTANAIVLDPGGAVYLSDGVFHRTQVETILGPVRNNDAALYRFEPRTARFETYVAYGFANPHGKVFDRWGNDIVTDATGNANYFAPAFSGHIDYPNKHAGMRQFWDRPSRPCPGTGLLSSRHFPEEFQGNFLNANVIGFQGIYRVKVTEDGSGLAGETMEHLVSSDDPNFRPADVRVGPDGAVYFLDWHNPIIGHMQHHLRDPSRDHKHGRIYRITYEGRPLLEPPAIHGQPVEALLELLKSPENGTRELAKVELGRHDGETVARAARKWIGTLDESDPDYEHHLMEALWVHQWVNVVNADLLGRMLQSPDHRARAAAGRVLCYWRDRVPDALDRFAKLAEDEHPRVRLEAVRAASFYRSSEAADVALAVLKKPTDYYLDYTLRETMRQLEPWWREAVREGEPVAADNPAGVDYLLSSVTVPELLNLPRTAGVLEALLTRSGVADADRAVALAELAEAKDKPRAELLLELLDEHGDGDPAASAHLAEPLAWLAGEELMPVRRRIANLKDGSRPRQVKSAAWAALALADGSFDDVWREASASPRAMSDLLAGIPLLLDPDFRALAYDRVQSILEQTPENWTKHQGRQGTPGRYVRIELPRRGTLTLAEVEVLSEGRNIARGGKASQSSTAHGGDPERAVDGRKDGSYGSGTQTHTRENERRPWWELDLGQERSIESVGIWNRTDGSLGDRLDEFTLTVLDGSRNEVFKRENNPVPRPEARIEMGGGDPVGRVRRAAIEALVSMGQNRTGQTFATLAGLIRQGEDITGAARGLRMLPHHLWPKQDAEEVTGALLKWAKSVPPDERTSMDYIETVQVTGDLAGLLPEARASAIRAELKELRVAVFVIRTVREQMRYDTPRLVVEAGKPFEIIIENVDFMPHNLVVVKPGTRSQIGAVTDKMLPDQLDSRGRAFVPDSPDILAATKLLEPGMKETLQMTAPEREGDYEYVCTFPGHWMVMWGRLIVTRDVEAYLKDHPIAAAPVAATEHAHHFQGE